MAIPAEILEPDCYYHVYNRAVGSDLLFKNNRNYLYFLKLSKKYLDDYFEILAYCLMSNHFHFLIRVKSFDEISKKISKDKILSANEMSRFLSMKFGHLFNSYAQAFNKENHRVGSLFKNNFKRKRITTKEYLVNVIQYIHYNPKAAGLVKNITDWEYSSYQHILVGKGDFVKIEDVVELFDDLENFVFVHSQKRRIDEI